MGMMLSIILPTLNEADNIERMIRKISKAVRHPFEIIVVDDGSTDGTTEKIRAMQKRMKNLRLISRKKRGLGGAILKGLRAANGEFIVTMDADISHDPEDIEGMLKAMRGKDVVLGSRYLPGARVEKMSLKRLIVSKGANLLTKLLLGLEARDLTNNFRIYRAASLGRVDLGRITNESFSFLVEILFLLKKKGCKFAEYPIRFRERKDGLSKLNKSQYFKFALTVLRIWFQNL